MIIISTGFVPTNVILILNDELSSHPYGNY